MNAYPKPPQAIPVAVNATAVGPSAAVRVSPRTHLLSVFLDITGGTARSAQWQVAPTANGPWTNVGVVRSTIATFAETIQASPYVRLNVTANTGSTFNAWVYSEID